MTAQNQLVALICALKKWAYSQSAFIMVTSRGGCVPEPYARFTWPALHPPPLSFLIGWQAKISYLSSQQRFLL
nr:hypothetical protein [uncultured Desulfobulbus sp.]